VVRGGVVGRVLRTDDRGRSADTRQSNDVSLRRQ
jgi:hypothetical protein